MPRKTKSHSLNPANIFTFVFKEERRSSLLLILAVIMALVLANSAWSNSYFELFSRKISFGLISLDIRHWINEGLMAFFFLVVGLEVKRELIDGELKTWKKAAFPLVAAVGGMLAPALIFTLFNPYLPQNSGWGIPMATDIAIAVGVLALLGRRIPKSLRVFLLSLAIIDDIGSILIISLFYSKPTNMLTLVLAIILSLSLLLVRKQKWWLPAYVLIGFGMWYCIVVAGLSGTMAGVVIALLMPLAKRRSNASRLQTSEIVEDALIPLTSFLIVPLFVFANAGLRLANISLSSSTGMSVFTGVLLGLLIGKPLGIVIASWTADTLKIAERPTNTTWSQICGIGFLAGIGFTISLLIGDLAYGANSELHSSAVLGIFSASVLAAVIGLLTLRNSAAKG